MDFFSLALMPNNENACMQLYHHEDVLCSKCGFKITLFVKKTLRLTMAVLDIDYGAFIRRPMDWGSERETPPIVLNNRYKFTLKMNIIKLPTEKQEVSSTEKQEVSSTEKQKVSLTEKQKVSPTEKQEVSCTEKQEVIICHLYEGNKYQKNIDVQLDSGLTVEFSCQQTCSIHLIGYYLN
ncbi:uncharacterized protein LOC112597011 [Melanaphis sacchari]|uniref:uncharacterized protein LOC112597011 n=1 Tax=Melanaphis sacchari TaxID=742174 RepID=UPI000DC138EC|nr:uncharacterized protein LOC112597011 [Melanaphis sacchari]